MIKVPDTTPKKPDWIRWYKSEIVRLENGARSAGSVGMYGPALGAQDEVKRLEEELEKDAPRPPSQYVLENRIERRKQELADEDIHKKVPQAVIRDVISTIEYLMRFLKMAAEGKDPEFIMREARCGTVMSSVRSLKNRMDDLESYIDRTQETYDELKRQGL